MKIKNFSKYAWAIGFFVVSVTIVVVGIRCSSNKSSTNGGTSGQPISLSGSLISGTVALNTTMVPLSNASLNTLDVPLTGDVLYCVTFSNTPASAKSQPADSNGNVSLTIAAQNVPFGCFVVDTSGNAIASLVFSGSTGNSQAMKLSGNADLGTITVDKDTGLAVANMPSGGTLVSTTPTGVDCPIGEWQGTVGCSPCAAGNEIMTIWIAKLSSGGYIVNMPVGPDCQQANCSSCGMRTFELFTSATYQNDSFTFQVQFDPNSCPQKVATITLSPDSTCRTAIWAASTTNAGSCTSQCDQSYPNCGCGPTGQPGGVHGCGITNCTMGPYTFTRQ